MFTKEHLFNFIKDESGLTFWRIGFFAMMASQYVGWRGFIDQFISIDGMRYAFAYPGLELITDICAKYHYFMPTLQTTFAVLACVNTKLSHFLWFSLQMLYLSSSTTHFVNHEYLFALLSAISAISYHEHKTGHLLFRIQFCIMYLYAALWKLHEDWLSGRCIRIAFVAMDKMYGGILPFAKIYDMRLWSSLAYGGLVLDMSMFLTCFLCTSATHFMFLSTHILFHGFNLIVLSKQIGITFPIVCILSLFIFLSKESERSVFREIKDSIHHRPVWNKRVVMIWSIVQLLLPARMPFISKGEYPYTKEGYRFSWTMMLHGTSSVMQFDDKHSVVGVNIFEIFPMCGNHDIHVNSYLPPYDIGNPSALPLHRMFTGRHSIILHQFPESIHRAIKPLVPNFASICNVTKQMSMRVQYFTQLNGKGGFHRLLHPIINTNRPSILKKTGCVNKRLQVDDFRRNIQNAIPGQYNIIVDRSSCLALLPLTLMMPKKLEVAIHIRSKFRRIRAIICNETGCDFPSHDKYHNATFIKIGTQSIQEDYKKCAHQEEDVMIGIAIKLT